MILNSECSCLHSALCIPFSLLLSQVSTKDAEESVDRSNVHYH